MKQSKFSLADVLTVLTALAFAFVCFLGTNFFTLGDTSQSIILSLIIFALLSGTALGAKLFKRTNRNFKTNFILEILMLVLFTGFMIFFAYSPFPHYFVVSDQKLEIQNKLRTSITQSENMFTGYEGYVEIRESTYKGKLQAVAAAKNTRPKDYIDYGFVNGSVPDDIQVDNKMFTIHTLLLPPNYSNSISKKGIKEVAITWLKNAEKITSNWKPIGIVSVVNNVEKNSEDWRNQLINLSIERGGGEEYFDFDYKLSFDDVKTHFTTLSKPTPLSIGLSAGAYLLMLLSYLISKRSSKTTVGTTKQKGKYDIDF